MQEPKHQVMKGVRGREEASTHSCFGIVWSECGQRQVPAVFLSGFRGSKQGGCDGRRRPANRSQSIGLLHLHVQEESN
jgi:hypothetical protein